MLKIYTFNDYNSLSEELLTKMINALPNDRRTKAIRYKRKEDKISCIVSYCLLVYGLKKDYGIHNPKIGFGRYGKPFLLDYPKIYFNISHCRYGCVCAFSDREVGVDIQDIRPVSDNVIDKVCCQNEINVMQNFTDRNREFTKIWAMKESYVKMMGIGMLYGLKRIDTTKLSEKITVIGNDKYYIAVAESEV